MSRVWWRIPLVLLVSNSVSGTCGSASGKGPHTPPPLGPLAFPKIGFWAFAIQKVPANRSWGVCQWQMLVRCIFGPSGFHEH